MQKITNILQKAVDLGVIISLGLLSIIISLEVFSRYFFNLPLPWSMDVNRMLFVYLIFLGAVAGVREKAHLSIDIVTQKFSAKFKAYWDIFINLIILIFLATLFIAGINFSWVNIVQLTPYLRISISYYYMVIPFSAILMIYYFIFRIKNQIINILKKKQNCEEE